MFEALAESEAEARASGTKDKAAPGPSLIPMMVFRLMVMLPLTTPMNIMTNGWSGKSLLANRRDRESKNHNQVNMSTKHW